MNQQKLCGVLVFVFGMQTCLPVFAQEPSQSSNPPTESLARASRTEDLISPEYGKLLLDDSWHVLSSPARWNQRDWVLAGLGTAAIVATAAFADEPLQEEIQENRDSTSDDLAEAFEPFGEEYSFAVLGAFEVAGLIFHDDRARQTAQDGLAASLIAAGMITPSIQLIVGRSRPIQGEGVHDFSPFGGNHSYPSGHTTQAFAVASVIAEHYDPWWVKVACYGTAAMVGYSRMETDFHWGSDVLAGAIIGTFVGRTVVYFNKEQRYQLSPVVDRDTIGVKATHTF